MKLVKGMSLFSKPAITMATKEQLFHIFLPHFPFTDEEQSPDRHLAQPGFL